jgi:hypothetical protein
LNKYRYVLLWNTFRDKLFLIAIARRQVCVQGIWKASSRWLRYACMYITRSRIK